MDDKKLAEVQATDASGSELQPERPSAIWTRRAVIAAFWAVIILTGLPHWSWTTSIHRSSLPLEAMNAWADGKACRLQYPIHINLQADPLRKDLATTLASNIETLLNGQQSLHLLHFSVHSISKVPANTTTGGVLTINVDTTPSKKTPQATLRSWLPVLDAEHSIVLPSDVQPAATFLSSEVTKVFDDESASIWHQIKDTAYAGGVRPLLLSAEKTSELDRRTTRAFKYAPTYHLTFSLFTPTASPSAWEVEQALQEYISPLLTRLSSISDFTVNTQVQLFASFSPSIAGPVFDESKNTWTLHHSDLTGFINAAEWPLNPSIGSGPTLNFALYVPSPDKKPLLIEGNAGTSWIIPQWGGVRIHNAPIASDGVLTVDDLRPDMLAFADQLAGLVGLPPTPPSLSLRLSSLTRERATALILSASSTLGALSRLTLKLTSIAIPVSVAKAVDETLNRLDEACHDLQTGDFQRALENARVAEVEVERAFFEPSMVGQVYFPEEHKVAVYVPLLGPMAVPLVMSAIKELKSLRERKRKTA